MTGLNSNTELKPESFITPKQQQINKNKKEKQKFILCLILTNLLTALLLDSRFQTEDSSQVTLQPENIPGHTRMSLPLRVFVPLSTGRQLVGLYNKQGQLIVKKAYLVTEKKESGGGNWSTSNRPQEYALWVPSSQVSNLTTHSQDQLMAYPYDKNSSRPFIGHNTTSKEKSYEIIF